MPAPAFTISLDFELHWGIWDHTSAEQCRTAMLRTRKIVPELLSLFKQHEIAATWASVGALFCRSRKEMEAHIGSTRRPGWLDRVGVGSDESDDPLHFAPSIIEKIRCIPRQEIASHTFSHLECVDEVSTEAAEADLRACREMDAQVTSLVFPRNVYSERFLRAARKAGFSNYRSNPDVVCWKPSNNRKRDRAMRLFDSYLPIPHRKRTTPRESLHQELTPLVASRFLRPLTGFKPVDTLRDQRVMREMSRAARAGENYHLWWHPHNLASHPESLEHLDVLLSHFGSLRNAYGFRSASMRELEEEEIDLE